MVVHLCSFPSSIHSAFFSSLHLLSEGLRAAEMGAAFRPKQYHFLDVISSYCFGLKGAPISSGFLC